MSEPDEAVTLVIPAQSRSIRLARLVGAGIANDLGVDIDGLDDVRLAIGEACGLAAQFGVPTIRLEFSVADTMLIVRGVGSVASRQPDASSDDEQLKFARQILDVACAVHELTVDESGLLFSLSFAHGR